MNEKELSTIMTWLDELEQEDVGSDWPQDEYEEVIFSKWALSEMLQLVQDHPFNPASETVLRFGLLMITYIGAASTDGQRRIFQIAAATAWELLDNIEEVKR